MKIQYIIVAFFFFSFCSCNSENPYVDKETIDALIKSQNPDIEHVAVIYGNDIFYLDNLKKPGVRITNSPQSVKKQVKISHDHKKIAYKDANGHIVIVDLSGKVLATLTEYSNIKCFNWSADDKTLYMLIGNKLVYYGPALDLPAFTYGKYGMGDVLSASVSMKGDLAYTIRVFDFERGYIYMMIVKKADKSADLVFQDGSSGGSMSYVAFSVNKQDLVLGISENSQQPEYLNKLYMFIDLKGFQTYYYGNSVGFLTPIFNESQFYLVGSFSDESSTAMMPGAIGFGGLKGKNILNNNYTTSGKPLYTDWK